MKFIGVRWFINEIVANIIDFFQNWWAALLDYACGGLLAFLIVL